MYIEYYDYSDESMQNCIDLSKSFLLKVVEDLKSKNVKSFEKNFTHVIEKISVPAYLEFKKVIRFYAFPSTRPSFRIKLEKQKNNIDVYELAFYAEFFKFDGGDKPLFNPVRLFKFVVDPKSYKFIDCRNNAIIDTRQLHDDTECDTLEIFSNLAYIIYNVK